MHAPALTGNDVAWSVATLLSTPIAFVAMTGLTDLVVFLVVELYGRIQEHKPLPTAISALVRRKPGHGSLPVLTNVLPTSLHSSFTDSSRNMNRGRQGSVHFSFLSYQLWYQAPSLKALGPSWDLSSAHTPYFTRL